jgi:branched-chain amino acid transport system permease protein
MFSLNLILVIFAGTILGGTGTVLGPLIGVGILEGYSEFVGPFSSYNVIGLGLALFLLIVLLPHGVSRFVTDSRFGSKSRHQSIQDSATDGAIQDAYTGPSRKVTTRLQGANGSISAHEQLNGSSPLLELQNVRKSFGAVKALQGANLRLGSAGVCGLIGANGSGKTTLLNCLSGLIQIDSGEIAFRGKRIDRLPAARLAKLGIARTFQVPQLIWDVSGVANIELGLARSMADSVLGACVRSPRNRRRARERAEIARSIWSSLGLPESLSDTEARFLSLGTRRMVEVGRAVAMGASLICLDEPAAGLSNHERSRLAEAIRGIADSGGCVLLIEHNIEFVKSVADSLVLLSSGTVVSTATDLSKGSLPVAITEYAAEIAL